MGSLARPLEVHPLSVLRGPNRDLQALYTSTVTLGDQQDTMRVNCLVHNCSWTVRLPSPSLISGENALEFPGRLTRRLFPVSFLERVKFPEQYIRNHSNGLRKGWVDQ